MKKFLGLALGLIMVMVSGIGFGQIYHTGYEIGEPVGTNISGTGAPIIDSVVKHLGVNSIKNGVVERLSGLDILTTYKVSFWMKTEGTVRPLQISHIRAPEWGYSDKVYMENVQSLPYATTSDWKLYEHEFLDRGTFELFIFGQPFDGATSWIDDVSVSIVRTQEQNKTYYQGVLNDPTAKAELKTEANIFFANLYEYVDKTPDKAVPYLEVLGDASSLKRVGRSKTAIAESLPKTNITEIDAKIAKYNEADLAYGKAVNLMDANTQGDEINRIMSQQNIITEKIIQLNRLKKGM